ncbi:MAG: T9SS type A sorting domain-containing protein [Bacteroidales bacterium]|nr:T9SS type A sorting domain-containing protein [Bacteroidales bacterium]
MKRILLIFMFSIGTLLKATTYYIDPNGDDITGTGAINSPFRSLFKACEVAIFLGDIIHVNSGIYNETKTSMLAVGVSIEGVGVTSVITSTTLSTEGYSILRLLSNEIADGNQSVSYLKFDGGALTAAGAIKIQKRNDVKIHNCTFVDFHYYAVAWDGDGGDEINPPTNYVTGSEFYNNSITNCAAYTSYAYGALYIGGQDGMLIHDNNISQKGRPSGKNGWPIKIWGNGGWARGLKIYNNTLFQDDYTNWDFCIEGLHFYGLEIYNNTITGAIDLNYCSKGTYAFGAYIHHNILGHEMPIEKSGTAITLEFNQSDVIISNNRIRNVGVGIYYTPRTGNTVTNQIVSYNIFEDIGGNDNFYWGAIRLWADTEDFILGSYEVYNNVFYSNPTQPVYYGVAIGGFTNGLTIKIINNIFLNFNARWLLLKSASNLNDLYVQNNMFHNNGNNNVLALTGNPSNFINSGNIIDNPDFYSESNYHLQASSPAVDAGLQIPTLTKDFDGTAVSNPPNIGCFETIAEFSPPEYIKSVIENATPNLIEITFDIPLKETIPEVTDFAVKVNSLERIINSIAIIEGKVQLTLSKAIFFGDIISISYTVPTLNSLKSIFDIEAESFNSQLVINNVGNTPNNPLISFSIYPNPTSNNFKISIIGDPIFNPISIKIYDQSGRKCQESVIKNNNQEIPISNIIESGLFIVQLTSENIILGIQKLIVSR